MTVAEGQLWNQLRKLDMNVRRQAPIGRYVLDFAHHAFKLVIEVDGYWHNQPGAQDRDGARDAWLASQGYQVFRVRGSEVRDRMEDVIGMIEAAISSSKTNRAR